MCALLLALALATLLNRPARVSIGNVVVLVVVIVGTTPVWVVRQEVIANATLPNLVATLPALHELEGANALEMGDGLPYRGELKMPVVLPTVVAPTTDKLPLDGAVRSSPDGHTKNSLRNPPKDVPHV